MAKYPSPSPWRLISTFCPSCRTISTRSGVKLSKTAGAVALILYPSIGLTFTMCSVSPAKTVLENMHTKARTNPQHTTKHLLFNYNHSPGRLSPNILLHQMPEIQLSSLLSNANLTSQFPCSYSISGVHSSAAIHPHLHFLRRSINYARNTSSYMPLHRYNQISRDWITPS